MYDQNFEPYSGSIDFLGSLFFPFDGYIDILARTIEACLDVELDCHIKHERLEYPSSRNRLNGYVNRWINITRWREPWASFLINVPRDRDGSFLPILMAPYTWDAWNVARFAHDLFVSGISENHADRCIRGIYQGGAHGSLRRMLCARLREVSADWQSRKLLDHYTIIHCIMEECPDKNIAYHVYGVTPDNKGDILGMYIVYKGKPSYWKTIFKDLKERGVKSIAAACFDPHKTISGALKEVFPHALYGSEEFIKGLWAHGSEVLQLERMLRAS